MFSFVKKLTKSLKKDGLTIAFKKSIYYSNELLLKSTISNAKKFLVMVLRPLSPYFEIYPIPQNTPFDSVYTRNTQRVSNFNINLPQDYIPYGYVDSNVIRVYKKDEARIFCYTMHVAKYEEVLKRMASQNLLGTVFVKITHVTPSPEGNYLLLEQDFVQPTIPAYNYPPAMLYTYAFSLLDFVIALDKVDLHLVDAGIHNGIYKNGVFKFFDLGAIDLGKMPEPQMLMLIDSIVNPLVLMSHGEIERAYRYLRWPTNPLLSYRDIKGYMNKKQRVKYRKMLLNVVKHVKKGNVINACEYIKSFLRSIQLKNSKTIWSDYSVNLLNAIENKASLSDKYNTAVSLFRKTQSKSFIDLAGNTGILSLLLKDEVDYSICADADLNALNYLWEYVQKHTVGNVIPSFRNLLVNDIRTIRPNEETITWLKPSHVCECAFALAILHHLVFTHALGFDEIVNILFSFTEKYLIVQFIDMQYCKQHWEELRINQFPFYDRANFETALLKCGRIIEQEVLNDSYKSTFYLLEKY